MVGLGAAWTRLVKRCLLAGVCCMLQRAPCLSLPEPDLPIRVQLRAADRAAIQLGQAVIFLIVQRQPLGLGQPLRLRARKVGLKTLCGRLGERARA
jgi:hypothetical protein